MFGETKEQNDLFYTCSLIEYITRKTKNKKKDVIDKLGENKIKKIYELAEVYHSDNIEKVADDFINECNISIGKYNYIDACQYRIPSYYEIGKVYQRLIIMVNSDSIKYVDTLLEVLNSWIIEKIDNYNSSMYYENPDYIYQCYIEGRVL